MSLTSFDSHVARMPPSLRLLLFGATITLLGCVGAFIRPAAESAALWWPGAGIGVVGLLLARPRQRLPVVMVLVVAGTLSNLYGDRPLLAAVLFALVNAVEAIVVSVIMSFRRPEPRAFRDLDDLRRVLVAVLFGALTAGSSAGIVGVALLGEGFVATAGAVAASHAAAVMVTVPFVLSASTVSEEATRFELIFQWSVTVTVTALVFSRGQELPLAFLLPAALLWPALRSSLRATTLQLLTMGSLAAVLSRRVGGPFAAAAGGSVSGYDETTIALVQVLMIASAATMLAVFVTVSQRRALLLDITRREELFRVGFTESLLGMLLLRAEDDELRIIELNGVAARLLDGAAADLIGTNWCEPFAPADRQRVRDAVATMEPGDATGWNGEIHLTSSIHERWVEVSISSAAEGTAAGDLLTVQMVDVTARREAQAHLADMALRDGLTGLANRLLLDDRLERALVDARRTRHAVGVMFVDLDEFKGINDTYGHAAGDLVLVEVASRLVGAVRDSDTVARVGGDEFVIVFPNLENEQMLDELYHRVALTLAGPIIVDQSSRRLEASIGMTLGLSGSEARDLLRRADADMYTKKAASRATRAYMGRPRSFDAHSPNSAPERSVEPAMN